MHYDETEKRAHDSQIVRAKENLKLSHGGPSYSQAPGSGTRHQPTDLSFTSEPSISLRPTHGHAIKEETIAIKL